MKTKLGVNIHNKFDIEVKDIRTGEVRQRAEAYNIVLNGMYTQLCNLGSFFNFICFGTGTGTLSATRTTLFSYLNYKAAVDDTLIKAIPVSSWKRKIVLNPEEFVGSTLTEVGISNTTSAILTHALLKDSEGNQISITKTSTDVVTIYATVYITFSTQDTNIQFTGMPTSNPLVNYLIGGTSFPSCNFYVGENDCSLNSIGKAVETKLATSSPVVLVSNWVKDVANKKVSTPAIRFDINTGNVNITEIGFGSYQSSPIFRSLLPITGVFTGQSYSGVSIGTGDGVTKEFILPSKNIKQDSITIKVDNVINSSFVKSLVNNVTNFAFNDPITSVNGTGYGSALSNNGSVLAVAIGLAPYIKTYDFIGGEWIKRPDPAIPPASGAQGCALSGDGSVLAVAHYNSPFISTYDWNGSAWIKRPNPATLPPGTGFSCTLSSDGSVLVVGYNVSPFVSTYDWVGGAWIKRADIPSISYTIYGCSLSSNKNILALACGDVPFIYTYDWNGSAWVKRTAPATPPTNSAYGCSLSGDGSVLAVAFSSSPYIFTYDWNGSAWIKRPNPATLPPGQGTGCAISGDGNFMVVVSPPYSYLATYDWVGGAWIKRVDPTSMPSNSAYSCAISGDGSIFAVGYTSSPYISTYDIKKRQTKITFDVAPSVGAAITADYTVNGIHKTNQYVLDVSFTLQFGEVV